MANYLTFGGKGCECASCGRVIHHTFAGWTDEIGSGEKLLPVCRACLDGLDPKLRQVQAFVAEASAAYLGKLRKW